MERKEKKMFVLEQGKYTEREQCFGANWTLGWTALNNV
jgi:hypothetical protein